MADQSIQYTEEMVGAGHPSKADTLNRLALVEHNNDGTHKYKSWVDVREYGAVGDGVADDTAAIQAAIDTLTAGGVVFFPAGTYKVTAAITIKVNGVHIKGAGIGATTVSTASGSADIFHFGSGVTTLYRCSLSDMSITSSVTRTSGAAILLQATSTVRRSFFYNLHLSNMYNAIMLFESTLVFFNKIMLWGNGNGTGIHLSGGNDQYFTDCYGSGFWINFGIYKSGATWITSCDFTSGGGNCLRIEATDGSIAWLFISNSAFDTSGDTTQGDGIYINASSTYNVKGVTISNSWTGTNYRGIRIEQTGSGVVDGVQVVGHRAFNNQKAGISLGGGTNISVDATHCSGNGQLLANSYSGVHVDAGVSGFEIRDCHSGQEAGFGNSQKYGIEVASGASNNYMITGNYTRVNATGGVFDGGAGANKVIANNLS